MKYFVSRQRQWPDGTLMVEINSGGIDYANPGMLAERFKNLGEGTEFLDPREAVESALKIAEEWRKIESSPIEVGHGFTMGNNMPFDAETPKRLKAWADEQYEKLPKCFHCNELLGKETFTHEFADKDMKFCSEFCAEKDYNSYNDNEVF